MDKGFEELIKQVHSIRLPDNVATKIIKLGKPIYHYLLVKIDDPSLSEYQVINLLRILYQMRYQNIEQFINKVFSFTQDERINVRSTASWLAICLFKASSYLTKEFNELNNIPLHQERLIQLIHNSLAMGLHQSVRQQVETFIKQNI
ncbi:MAG: hypothetical protein RMZ41_010790 [Nostoc sp. DedVER02]|uniref:hypothetical protein n=1 Tax=unclassified Nostoc TaxID=2593658 RepID=UPI002AD3AE59|nr:MULTISPECIES: hypothetical protein [unclassified Nostoc]MDZ7986276.1 hypothetical protein [Nostoc sp. DedVER02]MDZ8111570.1 hypothetical protein [Nostoc sp. DedVER01b]